MKKYFTKPERRISDDLHEFDVTRLAGWSAVRIYSYIIIFALLFIGITENIEKLNKWSDWLSGIVWGSIIITPAFFFLIYFLARKRSTVLDFADEFPRYHTLEYYRGMVIAAGVFAVLMSILPFILGKKINNNGWGYAGLIVVTLIATLLFWYICVCSKTETPREIESARRSSWSPQEEEQLEADLRRQLEELDARIEHLVINRGDHPCKECNGAGMIVHEQRNEESDSAVASEGEDEDDSKLKKMEERPPVIQERECEKCLGTGKLEWANDAQKQVWGDFMAQRERCVAELRKLDDSGDWKQMSLTFRFPWFTEHGHPAGDEVPDVLYQASADGLQKFRGKNERLFTEWQSLLEDADPSQTYSDRIGQWGKTYVSHKLHSSESRELKTLSYHLYQVVKNNSLSELQQVELCLAAAQSLTKQRENVSHPPLDINVPGENAVSDEPKIQRVKAVITFLWDVAGLWRDPMSKVEEEMLWEKIKKWHLCLQRVDDEDEDGEIEEYITYRGKLEDWIRNDRPESEWPGVDYVKIVNESLTPKEHSELVMDLDLLNEININKNIEKYNQKSLRISDWKREFDQIASMYGERKTFEVSSYPKFSTETLIDQEGTTDDTTILLGALLHDCGYKVRLYRTTFIDIEKGEVERMGVAVEIEGSRDPRLIEPSRVHKGMVYCESTPDRWYCNDLDITERKPKGIDVDSPIVKPEPKFEF